MQLTSAQLQSIKSWIVSNNNSVFDQSAVNALNALASPVYRVLRTELPVNEIMQNGFDWTRVDNASVGQARIWEWMTGLFARDNGGEKSVNPSKIQFLKGVGEAWKGNTPQAQVDHRRAILAHTHRASRVWEKLFVVATADWNVATNGDQTGARGSTTNPDTLGVGADGNPLDGEITIDIVIASESA